MKTYAALVIAIALHVSSFSADAADKGYLGVSLEVDAEGMFNPTLKTLTVKTVAPSSPAAKAGIGSGDQIIEIEGRKVAGSSANDLRVYMEGEEGQTLRMAIKKPTGSTTSVTVVLGPRPK